MTRSKLPFPRVTRSPFDQPLLGATPSTPIISSSVMEELVTRKYARLVWVSSGCELFMSFHPFQGLYVGTITRPSLLIR